MKLLCTIFLLWFVAEPLSGQLYNYFEGFDNLPVSLDSSAKSENPWQIGMPQKASFNEALSIPNAIMTDTADNYTPGACGSFTFTIEYTEDYWQYPYLLLLFQHKMLVDSLHAGGWIEASYDGGLSWNNIYNDPEYPIVVIDYSPEDTLFNGEIGFATNFTDNWRLSTLCWGVLADRPQTPPEPDSIMIRFQFASDSLAMPNPGWIIDNIEVYPEIIHTVEELRNMSDSESLIAYPNPAGEHLNLFYRIEQNSPLILDIFDLNSRLLYREERGMVNKGIYSEQIELNEIAELPRAIVLSLALDGRRLTQVVLRK